MCEIGTSDTNQVGNIIGSDRRTSLDPQNYLQQIFGDEINKYSYKQMIITYRRYARRD